MSEKLTTPGSMEIADRLEHCAKYTGLDAVRELLQEAAQAVRKRDAVIKLLEGEALQAQAQVQGELEPYDAGLLNDFGGGNVEWWQDYIRAELGHAHDFYQSQLAPPQPAQATQAEVTDADIFEAALPFGAFEYGDAQGDKRIAFARAILALRPAAVPMTDVEVYEAFAYAPNCGSIDSFEAGIRYAESHFGITAQAKKETP